MDVPRDPASLAAGLIDRVRAIVYIDVPDASAEVGFRTIYLSRGIETLLGYAPGEFLAEPDRWVRIVHPEDLSAFIERTVGHLATPSQYSSEYRVIARDGSVLTVRDECSSGFDRELGVIASRGVITDISPQRRSETQFQAFLERLPIVAYIESPIDEEPFRYLGPQIEALTGHQPADFFADARLFPRLVHPEDRELQLRGYGAPGQPYAAEYRLVHRDGRIVWVQDQAVVEVGPSGDPVAIHGFLMDSTAAHVATQAAAEAEDRYRSLVERLPITMYTEPGEMDGPFLYIGPQVAALTGYSPADFYADEDLFQKLMHPDDMGRMLAGYGDPDRPYSTSYRLIRRDGETIWVHDEAVVETDPAGGAPVIHGFLLDITTERRAALSLESAETRYRSLVEELPLVTYIAETEPTPEGDQVIRYISPQVETLLGYPPNQWTNESSFARTVIHPDDVGWVYSTWRADPRAASVTEYRFMAADGRVVWVRDVTTTVVDSEGGPDLRQGFLLDVTLAREAREGLESAEERYRSLVEGLPFVTYLDILDQSGHGTHSSQYISPQVKRLLGVTPADFEDDARLWRQFVHPDDAERAFVHRPLETWGEDVVEYRMVRADGEMILVRDQSWVIEDIGDGRLFVQGYVLDITDAKRAEEALVRAQKLESLSNLAGGIAHDFNNLLVSILGNAELALMDLPADHSARHGIVQVEVAARRAADLARQMLAYSGRGQFVVQPLAVNDLVSEIVDLLRVAIDKGVGLSLRLADDLPAVEADATQLRQVVMNIVVNASDAIGTTDGRITIATERATLGHTAVAGLHGTADLEPGEYVVIEISDTGPGMDPGTLRRIFDPFFTTKFAGRGLGLAAVLGIVSGHRGGVAVESQPGRGARFRIYLPPTARPVAQDPPTGPATGSRHGTILVADDEPAVRMVARRMLERVGWTIEEVGNGALAVERVASTNGELDAVLLDLTMPVLDGAGAMMRIHELRPDLPVVLMSGYTETDAVQRFGDDGLAGFVQKPFTPAELSRAIDDAIARVMRD